MANSIGPRDMVIHLGSEDETANLARILAAAAAAGDVIGLAGNLGVGKTAFARAFIRARTGANEVPSPTFTLVQTYDPPDGDTAPAIWHLDLYRLEDPAEAGELGLDDALGRDIVLIEWPERIDTDQFMDWLLVELRFASDPEAREAQLYAHGPRAQTLLGALANPAPVR